MRKGATKRLVGSWRTGDELAFGGVALLAHLLRQLAVRGGHIHFLEGVGEWGGQERTTEGQLGDGSYQRRVY